MAYVAGFILMLADNPALAMAALVVLLLGTEWLFRGDNTARFRYPLILVMTLIYFGAFVKDAFQANAVMVQFLYGLFGSIAMVTVIFGTITIIERIKLRTSQPSGIPKRTSSPL